MDKKFKINKVLFWPPLVVLVVILILSFVDQDGFAAATSAVVNFEVKGLAWIVGPTILLLVFVCAFLLVHPKAKVKFGGADAVPKFKKASWWGMMLCSTIAIGVVFWGVAQPMTYFMDPSVGFGVDPGSDAAAVKALAQTNLEWSGQYVLYGLFGVGIALAAYNYNQPLRVSSFMYFINGKPANRLVNEGIDILCLIAIVSGVTCSLGTGTMQVTAGLNSLFDTPINKTMWLVVIIVIVGGFFLASFKGIAKGIKFISDQNMRLYYFVMIVVLILGPTHYIFSIGMESTALMFETGLTSITYNGGVNGDDWPIFWMIWLYVSAAAFAPIVGLFMAKISYGRTVREMVVGACVIPALFNLIWFVIFGGTAIKMQQDGDYDIWGALQELGLEASIFEFFGQFPGGVLLNIVFLVVIYFSFITLASSATTTVSYLTTTAAKGVGDDEEPPLWIKAVWAVVMGVSAYTFIGFAGIEGAKSAALIGGMPIVILCIFLAFSVIKGVLKSSPDEIIKK